MMLTHQQVKFDWTSTHHTAFLSLKVAIIQAPILHYPDPIRNTLSDDAYRAQLLQEHDKVEFPITFLSHSFTETQRKWSTTEQETYGVYYAITKWNYYLQGTDITVKMIIKSLAKFLNGKNANNKVNRWSLDLATYNITFKWISEAKNKAANCLSWLVEQPTTTPATVNMLTVTHTQTYLLQSLDVTQKRTPLIPPPPHSQIFHQRFLQKQLQHPKPLTVDRLEALLQMQRTGSFYRCICKCFLNGKAPQHETNVLPT